MARSSSSIRLRLSISAEKFLQYYSGSVKAVSAIALDGRRVEFPASALRPHVEHDGIQGLFNLQFGPDHKLIGLTRISS